MRDPNQTIKCRSQTPQKRHGTCHITRTPHICDTDAQTNMHHTRRKKGTKGPIGGTHGARARGAARGGARPARRAPERRPAPLAEAAPARQKPHLARHRHHMSPTVVRTAAALGGGHAAAAGGRRVVRPDTTCGNTHSVSEVGLAGVGVSLALKRAWIACGSVA